MDRFENRRHWPFLDRRRRPGSSPPPPVQLGLALGVAALFLFACILLVVSASRQAEPPASSFAPLAGEEVRKRPGAFASRPAPEEAEGFPAADGCPEGCLSAKPGCEIKGNISQRKGERIHHLPGQRYYEDTVISPENGERWFCTEEEAKANGWRRAKV